MRDEPGEKSLRLLGIARFVTAETTETGAAGVPADSTRLEADLWTNTNGWAARFDTADIG